MKRLIILGLVALLIGCATQLTKTNTLTPGMTPEMVTTVLGQPQQTELKHGNLVWKYSLHQPWKGFVPFYVVFKDGILESFYADEAEYQRQQQLWIQAFPPPQQHNIYIEAK